MVNNNSKLSVLVDSRLVFHAGIGRYSLNLCRSLLNHNCSPKLTIISPAGLNIILKGESLGASFLYNFPDRYTIGELIWLYHKITKGNYHIFHTTNYVIPLKVPIPSIVTIHDIMRLRLPEYCHSNTEFIRRFGISRFISLAIITSMLLFSYTNHRIELSSFRSKNITDSKISYYYQFMPKHELKLHHIYIYFMTLLAIKNAKAIVTVSEFSKKEIIDIFNVNPEKIHVIYPGIDPNFRILNNPTKLKSLINKLGLKSHKYFLHVGLKRRHKNLITLINAFIEYVKENTDPYYLIFVGPYDEDFENIRKYSYTMNKNHRIIFLNNINDEELNILYNGATAILIPSIYEGFGFPLVEAMACGVPIVASNIAVVNEICRGSALLVPPLDVRAWVKALDIISKNMELRNLLLDRSAKQVQRFNWYSTITKIIDLYNLLMTNK